MLTPIVNVSTTPCPWLDGSFVSHAVIPTHYSCIMTCRVPTRHDGLEREPAQVLKGQTFSGWASFVCNKHH